MTDAELARLLCVVADSLERQDQASSGGLVRQAARIIAEHADPSAGGCERCGAELARRPTGRRRRFCSDRCRKAAGKFRVVS